MCWLFTIYGLFCLFAFVFSFSIHSFVIQGSTIDDDVDADNWMNHDYVEWQKLSISSKLVKWEPD